MELDGSDNVVRKYTWGLDLAGQHGEVNSLEAAGGIGGLLAVAQAQVGGGSASGGVDAGDYVFTYDANGNVAQVLDLSAGSAAAAIVARYEYDPYGGVVNDLSGYSYAEANPIRFSTKYWDAETGLGYWGYRYYSARLGRWLSRDPLGEAGGTHLYAYVFNQPTVSHDALGLWLCGKEDCRKKLGEALEDPRIKKMVEEARKLKHWWGMPCFGRVRCTCVCPKDMGGWADPISGDALVCAKQTHCMTQAQFNDVVREEIAHHMLMCGNINDWLWRCRGCMREEKRLLAISCG